MSKNIIKEPRPNISEYKEYRLVDYFDVWGNEEGWQVNDLHDLTYLFGHIYISEDATGEEIIDHMILIDYFGKNAKENVEIEFIDDCFIEFTEIATGRPLGRLEAIKR